MEEFVSEHPDLLKSREVEYCVIQLDYNSHRHSNLGRKKGRIHFCACELYELRIIKSFLRLSTQESHFRVACGRVRLQNPDNFFGIVKLPKRKIRASHLPESAYFERHEIALKMSRFR